ncbi:MAG TPA: hypothetical protein VMS08_05445 [Candidatus Saccharimonadia bacterium]|nr:hypothetical protein [Candidatus Saccharimonadia bacterium]
MRVPDLFADAYKGTDREKVAADLAAFIRDWCTTSRPAICLRGTDTREEIITDRGPHGYREGPGLINLRRWSRYVLEAILCDPPLTRSGSIQRINFMGAGLAYLLQPHDGGAQLQRANAEAEIMRFAASFPR